MENKKNKKIHRLNIYLSYQDRKILNEIRDKYHISYSTIAKVIFRHLVINKNGKYGFKIWADHYYFEDDNSTKTSIKPRLYGETEKEFWDTLTASDGWKSGGTCMMFTNVIKAFTRKDIARITGWTEKEIQKITSQIYNQFQQEYDPNWNGNAFAHQFTKFVKQNPEYTKKILGQGDM